MSAEQWPRPARRHMTAIVRLLVNASNQTVFSKTSGYHFNERPLGGKNISFLALSETPATMKSGALNTMNDRVMKMRLQTVTIIV